MKSYIKPDLFYENFELNQNIAACGWDLLQNNKESCTAHKDQLMDNTQYDTDVSLFTDANKNCNTTEKEILYYCYTTGASEFARLYQS